MPSGISPVKLPVPTEGVRPDLHRRELGSGALYQANNWLRRDGRFRVRDGFASWSSNVAQRPTAYVQYEHHDRASRIVQATTTGWWRYSTSTGNWVDITDGAIPLTGSQVNLGVFRTFPKATETWLLGVNGKDAPKKWNGLAATYANIGGSPPAAKAIMSIFDRVLLANLFTGPNISPVAVDVSANKDFDSGWNGGVLTALLADSDGEIRAMQEHGSLLGSIYKSDAVYRAIAQAGAAPFRFELVQKDIRGPASARAVAAINDGVHVYLADDGGAYSFDGSGVRLLALHVQRWIASRAALDRMGRAWVSWDKARQELWMAYPRVGQIEPSEGVVVTFPGLQCYPISFTGLTPTAGVHISVPSGITIGELVGTIGEQQLTIGEYSSLSTPILLAGHSGGQSYLNRGTTDAGQAIPHSWESGQYDLGSAYRWKTLHEVDHFFAPTPAAQQVTVKVGAADSGEEPDFDAGQAVDLGAAGPYRTQHRTTARLLALRVEGQASQPVEWGGAEAVASPRGPR